MAMRYPVKSGSSPILATNAGPYYTDTMSGDHALLAAYIEFFSDAAGTIPVTPTAGTVTISGRPMENNYIDLGTINATQAITPTSTYAPVLYNGLVTMGRVTFTGVTGAAYARVVFWRD